MAFYTSRKIKNWLAGLMARLARRPRITPAELHNLAPEQILIVRQQNQMGDMICATPVFRAMRTAFPEARLGLITSPVNVEVVRHNPHLDQIFTFDQSLWRNPIRLFGFLNSIRTFKPQITFVLSSVSFSVTSAAIGLVSGAKYVIGADSLPFGWDVSRHAFSLEMPANPVVDQHAVLHSLAPLEAIGIFAVDKRTVVVPAPDEEEWAQKIATDLDLKKGFWAVHPGAGKKQNIWPAASFAEVVNRAVADQRQVLILHGPADAPALNELTMLLGDQVGNSVKIAPATPIGVGAALLKMADRFLCNDTGVMHLAGALAVPTVALFGPTDPELWKPPATQVVALRGCKPEPDPRGQEFGWMEQISPDQVWDTWSTLPANNKHQI